MKKFMSYLERKRLHRQEAKLNRMVDDIEKALKIIHEDSNDQKNVTETNANFWLNNFFYSIESRIYYKKSNSTGFRERISKARYIKAKTKRYKSNKLSSDISEYK